MTKVFIDGSAGTTGLRIYERLADRDELDLIILPDDKRKEPKYIQEAIFDSDITFLCLPDAAAVEAVALAGDSDTVIIDTSTAHRTSPDFVYGFPELIGYEAVASAKRIANPGCHASGFIALVYPLVKSGLIEADVLLTCFSITGYSGGGKKMIAEYEAMKRSALLEAPRQYGLSQQHKHLKEMTSVCGLENPPLFCPIVADYYCGMEVSVPVFGSMIKGKMDDVAEAYRTFYDTGKGLVRFKEDAGEEGFLSAMAVSYKDSMEISISGNPDRMVFTARFDNLGKGASGAAIQNMNIVMGIDESTGLMQ